MQRLTLRRPTAAGPRRGLAAPASATAQPHHRRPRPALPPRAGGVVRASPPDQAPTQQTQPAATAVAVAAAPSDDSTGDFYLVPLLRSFLLGVSAGALFEAVHVAGKFMGALADSSAPLWEALPGLLASLGQPAYVKDHAVAIGIWAVFYAMDALAVSAILKKFPNDKAAAAREVDAQVTLAKKIAPARLDGLARLVGGKPAVAAAPAVRLTGFAEGEAGAAGGAGGGAAPAATSASAATATLVAPPPTVSGGGSTTDLPPTLAGGVVLPRLAPGPARPGGRAGGTTAAPPGAADDLASRRARRGLRPGELDPAALPPPLAARSKELAGRRAYLKNFWYAAALSEAVPAGKPVGVELLGEKLTLFRDSTGAVRALHDVCPHRGAPLHQGWVGKVDGHDCVVCPYHGWAFDGSGTLRSVPAAEHPGEWPAKPLVDTYPIAEQGGFVWLFYGSPSLPAAERPPIPHVPELTDPSWKAVYGEIEFNCDHWGVFENAIDMAHIHYLHSDTFGNQSKPEIRGMRVEADAYGVTARFSLHNKAVSPLWAWSVVPEVHVTARANLPSTSVISFTLGAGLSFTTFVNTVPVRPGVTVNRFALVRRLGSDPTGVFNWGLWDRWARAAMLRILGEDKAMVEGLRPDMLAREVSVRADLPQTAFRKLRAEYLEMGYGVPPPGGEDKEADDLARGRGRRDM